MDHNLRQQQPGRPSFPPATISPIGPPGMHNTHARPATNSQPRPMGPPAVINKTPILPPGVAPLVNGGAGAVSPYGPPRPPNPRTNGYQQPGPSASLPNVSPSAQAPLLPQSSTSSQVLGGYPNAAITNKIVAGIQRPQPPKPSSLPLRPPAAQQGHFPPPLGPMQRSPYPSPSNRGFGLSPLHGMPTSTSSAPVGVVSAPSIMPSSSAAAPPPPMASPAASGLKSSFAQRYPTGMPPMGPPTTSQALQTPTASYGSNASTPGSYAPMPGEYGTQPQQPTANLNHRLGGLSLGQGADCLDLLQNRHILPPKPVSPPKPRLQAELWNSLNCSTDIFRSTLTKVPETDSLLKKSRLPLGVVIHPFRDLTHLPVIQCATIVRCRQCRTYINPFVHFVDQRRWRCNICYRVNELPEEFLYDPVSKSFGDPSRRPECKSSTIEFIAPSEYMLRPPQPAVYLFLLDISRQAVESGYVKILCDTLLDELDKLPGDSRTQVAFIAYDRSVHFYAMPEGANQPAQMTVCDVDDVFLPSPSDLLVNLQEAKPLVLQFLEELPHMVSTGCSTESALGAALQAAFKMSSPTGGRISVFQHILPTVGPGALANRENAAINADKKNDASLLGPATDFYKKLSLECSGQQIAVDLFAMGSQYMDIATLSGISKFSGGQVQHFPGYHVIHNTAQAAKFENALRRYLTRKIGFEAVMRVRCTRGLSLHAFHGNFFVRSTDLLSLPNVNPDAGFGIQVTIEEDLRDSREVTFQAALLYTSSRGERRIRVHTLCLPTCASVSEVIAGADQEVIVSMLTKFAADRAVNDSLADAKEGFVVSCVDAAETYRHHSSMSVPTGLVMPNSLRLLPLWVLACVRSAGFRNSARVDERSMAFSNFKSLPLYLLMQLVYPDLYRVDDLSDDDDNVIVDEADDTDQQIRVPQPPRLQLSFERISATGMYLLDVGDMFFLYLSRGLHQFSLEKFLGVASMNQVDEGITELPELENPESEKLRTFVNWLNGNKPYHAPIKIIREDGQQRNLFVERMVEDRFECSLSYFEFLQHLKQQMKS